jgi:hypothetical protein
MLFGITNYPCPYFSFSISNCNSKVILLTTIALDSDSIRLRANGSMNAEVTNSVTNYFQPKIKFLRNKFIENELNKTVLAIAIEHIHINYFIIEPLTN